MRDVVVRAVVIDRYAADPATATPIAPLLKPTTMRFDRRGGGAKRAPAEADNCAAAGVREKLVPNGSVLVVVTVPVITAPLSATNETDAPVTCVLVTVTT